MKKIGRFLVTTTTAGFIVLLPIFAIVLLLVEAFNNVKILGDKLVELQSPEGASPLVVILVTILLILAVCFLVGWVLVPRTKERLSNWLETKFLNNIPGYLLLKGIIIGYLGTGSEGAVRTAMLERLPGIKEIVLVIEALPDNRYTVFVPTSPNTFSGSVLVVREELLEFLDLKLQDVRETISFRGAGLKNLLKKS